MKNLKTMIFGLFIFSLMLFQSCEKDDVMENSQTSALNTVENIESIDDLSDNGETSKLFPIFNFTVEADLISMGNGCYTVQIRIYTTYDGQQYLIHSANVETCAERNINSGYEGVDPCLGGYKGDLIIKDTSANRCLKDWLDDHEDHYRTYKAAVEDVITRAN